MVESRPIMKRPDAHLDGRHIVYFEEGQHEKAADTGKEKSTKLMTWFHASEQSPHARHISYVDFPKYFR